MTERFTEVIPPEAKKEMQLMSDIDNLFHRLEGKLEEEERVAVENEIRDKIKQYRQLFRKEVEDEVKRYYERLDRLKRTA